MLFKALFHKVGKDIQGVRPEAVTAIQAHPWPGIFEELISNQPQLVHEQALGYYGTFGPVISRPQPELVTMVGAQKAEGKFRKSGTNCSNSFRTMPVGQQSPGYQPLNDAITSSKYDLKQYVTSPHMEHTSLRPNRPAELREMGKADRCYCENQQLTVFQAPP
jgi:hypothetical protein